MIKDYFLGLDVGSDSLGWAVTDLEYNLIKARGNELWGAYLFDEAETAAKRRLQRTARRRIARTRQRITLLQEIFFEEIYKADKNFFVRLNNSKYVAEDKEVFCRFSLFGDENFTDKEFYKEYPTIYHLRATLCDPQKAAEITDVRLLYLAVHHIIKNRGHFLFEGQTFRAGDRALLMQSFDKINAYQSENESSILPLDKADEIISVLKNKHLGKSKKENALKVICGFDKKEKTASSILKAISGGTVKIKDLFNLQDDTEPKQFCFDDTDFDKTLQELNGCLDEDRFALIESLKSVYDWMVLAEILDDSHTISAAMKKKFDKHKNDLALLKKYIKANCPDKYALTFRRQEKTDNYAAYVGSDRGKDFKHCSRKDFYKFLRSFVKDEYILSQIESDNFLPKPRSNVNGVIPYQLHLYELQTILKNAALNFPFLTQEQDGYSVMQKIEMLLKFRVPYYVGPLNTAHAQKGFAWVKKYAGKENLKITPWNFDEIVDKDASEDEFIKRMTNKCTYLFGADVLPKNSLLYSEFAFRNELNNLCHLGKRLDKQAREVIFDYAKRNKKVTIKEIGKLLERNGLIEKGTGIKENFSGTDGDFKNSLSSYVTFTKIFGEDLNEKMCEDIILWTTLTEDKERLCRRIKREYNLSKEQLDKIKGLNYSGWGRLSRELLTEICAVNEDGEMINLISAMRESGLNLMELLSQKYGFAEEIEKYNGEFLSDEKITYETVDNMYCSPAVKRAIWRTIVLVREIVKIRGGAPKRIFIEMARGATEDQKNKRTKSRKESLLELYKDIEDSERDWIKEIETTEESKFSKKKLFLYYRQMGKCAYSGKPISLKDVFNEKICDIDHIYPRSKIKDDSLDNLVLCYKTENSGKDDVYPVDGEIRKNMRDTWAIWLKKGLISEEKYKRLTRATALTQDELTDFINRQLVETRQSTKAIANLLRRAFPETDVVYSKAQNVADFKAENEIVKVRELNDLHHAKDAFFNIVVGNVYYVKFSRNAAAYFKNNGLDSYNLKHLFDSDVKGAWNLSQKERILNTARKNSCKVVRFTSEGEGKLFDATIKTKGANEKLIPLKRKSPLEKTECYGGYDSATTAYFSLVCGADKKGKKVITLESVPVYVTLLGECAVEKFITENCGLKDINVIINKIKINSLLKVNGAYHWLRGKSKNDILLCNANQLIIEENHERYLKKVISFCNKQKEAKEKLFVDEKYHKITAEENLNLYRLFYTKLTQKPYSAMSISSQSEFLKQKESVFAGLPLEEQCTVLAEVLHFFQCNAVLSNLELIGGVKHCGKIRISKQLKESDEVLLITQSPTGYYRNVIDLTAYYKL